MARRIVTVCDWHDIVQQEDVEIEKEQLYGIDGNWYRAGICPQDKKELSFAELETFIVEHGLKLKHGELPDDMNIKKARSHKKTDAGPDSLLPAYSPKTPPGYDRSDPCMWCPWTGTTGAFLAHAKKHGFHGVVDAYGDTCPVCNEGGFQLLGRHAMRHEVNSVAKLFVLAKAQGDPHGVYAKRLAAGQMAA